MSTSCSREIASPLLRVLAGFPTMGGQMTTSRHRIPNDERCQNIE